MRILLTGGSGDLGTLVSQDLIKQGDTPVILDITEPKITNTEFIQGSITERNTVKEAIKDCDMVIHIAAWHGVHEEDRDAYDFHNLNVTGSFNVFEAAAQAGIKKFILISSTSVSKPYGLYGHTKVLNEEMAKAYADRHDMDILILRPRAFIPSWNKVIYKNFIDWAKWFWRGAVHIDDVVQATMKSIEHLKSNTIAFPPPALSIDGKYDYTETAFNQWDQNGAGSTFKEHYPEFIDMAQEHGFDITRKPKKIGSTQAEDIIDYKATYSIQDMFKDLEKHGEMGPKKPF